MNSKHLRKYIFYFLLLSGLTLFLYSCEKDDPDSEIDPDKIELLSFGPSPALRGAQIQFIGRNLDKVTAVILPENIEIKSFDSQTKEKIELVVPEATVDGKVVLKTPQGDITSKSLLTISEPITIASITPSEARPGEKIRISGTYLNLVQSVIFKDNKVVPSDQFLSHTKDAIELNVPIDAQTGELIVSNGMEEPILVGSEEDFIVTLPVLSSFTPNPVKPGKEFVITGTDLDLVKELIFGGNKKVVDFTTKTATEIKAFVPRTAKDGPVKAVVESKVEVLSEVDVVLITPTISGMEPNPVKPGKDITISGTDLDLATGILFGGDIAGEIISKTSDELIANVPIEVVTGKVTIETASEKSVGSETDLALIQPVITSMSPLEIKSNQDLTINGTDLDLAVNVLFTGEKEAIPELISEEELLVKIPPGTLDGGIILVTTNGTMVGSAEELTILASNVPLITEFPETAKPGSMITLLGDKLDLLTDVIFPENVYATQFGIKTNTMLQVVVPDNVKRGPGVITFVTFEGETTTSPLINFQGVDPVLDPELVFFDFNGNGNKDSWWGNVELVNDENSLDGTSYGRILGDYNGWTDLFWRNANDNFPGAVIGLNVDDFVVKFDINIMEPITGGNLKMRLHPSYDDFWWAVGPAAPGSDGSTLEATDGWVTMTVEISEFRNDWGWGEGFPTDLTEVSGEFGMAFDNGESHVHVLIDNVRFEMK